MNIVVLMAGAGKDFEEQGHSYPKYLLEIHNKPIIQRVVESLKNLGDNIICIIRKEDQEKFFLGDMMNSYYTYRRENTNYMRINRDPVTPTGHATEVFTNWAIEYIKKAENEKSPFFMYLAYNAPHDPLQPPKEWLEKVQAREPGISDRRSRLVGLIEHLDYNVGRVVKALEDSNQLENTIIIFTSDNGGWVKAEANNGPHRGWKSDMYEGGTCVPFAIYWKTNLKACRRDNLVMMTDVFPTICDFADIDIEIIREEFP